MSLTPEVLWSRESPLRERLLRVDWHSLSCGPLEADAPFDQYAHVVLLSTAEAESVWSRLEPHAMDAPIFPVIVGEPLAVTLATPAILRLATVVRGDDNELVTTARATLLQHGALAKSISAVDSTVVPLSQNAVCECVRCSVGIIALAHVTLRASVQSLEEQLELLRVSSYALVDRVPSTRLSTDDLWALILIVKVPWSRDALEDMASEAAVLLKFVGNTKGSRKLVLTDDGSIASIVGPIATQGTMWHPTSDDPLREQLGSAARDESERDALSLLFKRRFSSDDIDHLVAILGRKT